MGAPGGSTSPGTRPEVGGGPLRQLGLAQLRQRTSAKWRAHPDDVLPAWVAEMDVPLARPIVEAVSSALEAGDTGYAFGTGYAEALAAFAKQRWGWDGLAVERTRLVADVMTGVDETLRLVTEPGDPVVVNCPVYPPFYYHVAHLGRRVIESPLGPDRRIDLDRLADSFDRAVSATGRAAFLLCSPHNPTGTVHTADELAAVAALAERFGVRVVVDEIHAPIVTDGSFVPFLSIPGAANAMSLMSASKGWNLAGIKAAVAVAGPAAAEDLQRLPEEVSYGASHIGVLSHTAALRGGGDWLDEVLRDLAANRQLVSGLLAEHLPGVRYQPEPGTYLAWLDCRELGLGDDPAAAFLERGRVALSGGLPFGTGGAGHARLNLATTPEILTEVVRRMALAVAS